MTSIISDREDLPIKWEHLIYAKNIFSWSASGNAGEVYNTRERQHYDTISIPELLPGGKIPLAEL